MATKTKIEWADFSWNPIRARNLKTGGLGHFCIKVGEECRNCYAEAMQKRLFNNPARYAAQDGRLVKTEIVPRILAEPRGWRKPRDVFVCSMTDLFGGWLTRNEIESILAEIAYVADRAHRFLILTKRADQMRDILAMLPERRKRHDCHSGLDWAEWPLPNAFVGVSVGTQRAADQRRGPLSDLAGLGWKTWVSYEPALGPVDWRGWEFLDGMVSGGESGHGARPSHPDWHRATRDFCAVNGASYHFKQWGSWLPDRWLEHVRARGCAMKSDGTKIGVENIDGLMDGSFDVSEYQHFSDVGKTAAGALLDGREWREFPQ